MKIAHHLEIVALLEVIKKKGDDKNHLNQFSSMIDYSIKRFFIRNWFIRN